MKRVALVLALLALGLTAVGASADQLPLPRIEVTPASYDYGDVPINAVASTYIVVKNPGATTITVNAVKTRAPFYESATSFVLGPGSQRKIKVGFAPTQTITYNGVCTIQSNAIVNPVVHVPLTGTGVPE